MTPQQDRVAQAEADARAARARLSIALTEVQDRFRPATLMREVRQEVSRAKIAARNAASGPSRQLKAGGIVVTILVLGLPLIRWRRHRRTAARAARIRGD